MKIIFSTSPARPKPREGDTKTVKGIEYVRRQCRVTTGPDRGCLVVSGGRPVFEWVRAAPEVPRG